MGTSFEEFEKIDTAKYGIYADIIIDKLKKEDFDNEKIYLNANELDSEIEQYKYFVALENKASEFKCVTRFKEMKKILKDKIEIKKATSNKVAENITMFSGAPIELKCGNWICDDNGVRREMNNGIIKVATEMPFTISKNVIDIENSSNEQVCLSYVRHKKWNDVIIPSSLLPNRQKLAERLRGNGVLITSDNIGNVEKYINDLQLLNKDKIPYIKGVSRLGWMPNGSFSPYDENLIFMGDNGYTNMYNAISCRGDYKTWLDEMKNIRKNKEIRMIMASSFASVLLDKVGCLPFIVHTWGTTGCGKTVALIVAMSIWGDFDKTKSRVDSTRVYHERACTFYHNIPYIVDELQTAKGKDKLNFDDFIMSITEGSSKGRGNKESTDKLQEWSNIIFTTGEEPITKDNSFGGAKNRVLEIEVDTGFIEDGNRTANVCKENFGFAGKKFVEKIQEIEKQDSTYLRRKYKELKNIVHDKLNTTGKQTDSVSIILLADEIASELFFDNDKLTTELFNGIALTNDSVKVSLRAYDFICDWIAENNCYFITEKNYSLETTSGKEVILNNKCYGKIQDGYTYVIASILQKALKSQNFDINAIKKDLNTKGLLEMQNNKYTTVIKINQVSTRVYKIKN